ncbi:UPF0057-domain-containing protein [Metschnikowia bicuspidata var. bicuspidata NRRL YB-4993]|uniref:UPF0057-domain-containing protein n=1 Tax=Metschnikowia bicuspidata var. bicuspidata NRRL YB-4993 TaxID=869754 RepID=A0A1A0H9A6_9ASCO|nr:UPF0057-domain-containing protein [Metschnikowia bicuspidata var. bicuspidata NRRL YB-4993]OBA20458.1 UPF0057-domain-containing protein [Metschnikowia bicuspidata var. bicuspidata NRRL YB-4993]
MCCCECMSDILLVVVSVLFPPLPVWIRRGLCSMDSLVNVLLCVLGYFPGLVHSWYIIAKYPPYSRRSGPKVYHFHQTSADLEGQRHHHHHHHHHCSPANSTVSLQPLASFSPTYGSTNDSSAQEGSSSGGPAGAPPAYSELPSKR